MILNIKPLSVNEAWKGKRFKTPKYKSYERDVLLMLPKMIIPDGQLCIRIKWGFSSAGSDIDNPCKPFLDCLQKKYGFNDSRVYRLLLDKEKVKKGSEFIEFEILPFESYQ